ncbi:MAG TPA: type II toxin-antitoxin system death-on-curing family toxin [Tessaracoccus flavescens]|uniref:Type II toxin-antitoxin system death-on-curing family toxin n=1 Tax=Tessaracoccus flavescens TaxID=399497 RepID=A0A921ENZ9_9ACTN|nr:type II toxin-antitoxin system death-on-curing family toxin [Tessaracoccus flavescens]
MTVYLTLEDLLALSDDLGVGPVRDLGLLESAAHRPSTSLWGSDAYDDVFLKAAALLDSVVNNHALVDGNKRLGWLATVVFLDLNGMWVEAPDDDAYGLVMAVAGGAATIEQIAVSLQGWAPS